MKEPKNEELEKAISIVELEKDKQGLIQQAQTIAGAIQYITQKIAELSKKTSKE